MAKKDIHGFEEAKPIEAPKGNNYLLVIGIDQYAHCPRLHNAVKDAKELVQVLKKRFQFEAENIIEHYDLEATKRNIYDAFRSMAKKVTRDDSLIIYFSGHGEYDKLFNLGYWIPVDAEKEAVDQYVPNSEIRNILAAIKSHHTFLMVDSCFSGMLFAQSTGRNISLRKERDPSRWGLTAGRNEIVDDGTQGTNSPFAKSIIYQLQHTEKPIGVAELCDNVLEVVSANATQTPRGEPLKVEGHKGGQFVFHLRKDEVADWKETINAGTLQAYQAFLVKYPEGKYNVDAKSKIKSISAEALWQKVEQAEDTDVGALTKKLRLVNQYVDAYENQPHYEEALNVGELLEYKKDFLQAKNSEFALRRFLRKSTPGISGAASIKKDAQQLLSDWNKADIDNREAEALKKAEQDRQEKEKRTAAEAQKREMEERKKANQEKGRIPKPTKHSDYSSPSKFAEDKSSSFLVKNRKYLLVGLFVAAFFTFLYFFFPSADPIMPSPIDNLNELVKKEETVTAVDNLPSKNEAIAKLSKSAGGGMGSGEFKVQGGVGVVLKNNNSDGDLCKVQSFKLTRLPKRDDPITLTNKGARYSNESKGLIQKAKNGDVYFFNNIKVKCSDNKESTVNSIAIEIGGSRRIKNEDGVYVYVGRNGAVKSHTGGDIIDREFKKIDDIYAKKTNCYTECDCKITHFELVRIPKRENSVLAKNNGSVFSNETVKLMARARPGDIYYFTFYGNCSTSAKAEGISNAVYFIK